MSLKGINENLNDLKDLAETIKSIIINIKNIETNKKISIMLIIIGVFSIFVMFLKIDTFRQFIISNDILSEESVTVINDSINIIFSLLLFVLIIILIFIIKKVGDKKIEIGFDTYHTLHKLHNDLIHKVRNAIYDLYIAKERLEGYANNPQAIQELQLHFLDNLINNLQHFIDSMSDLSNYNNDIISVCIKIIDSGQENVVNQDKTAKTLVRSKNTIRERKRTNETITIGKNTAFKCLCDGTNICFHASDLKKMYAEHNYETEIAEDDWQKKYNSTIVVPIRCYSSYNNITTNDILGFLCIDSKNTLQHWDNIDSLEIQYLAIYADSMYN